MGPTTEIKRKVNLLGEPSVGKTSLILRFVKNYFGEDYLKTIGSNVYTKKVPVTGSEVKLVIYDIMGESDFDSVRDAAFEKSTGAIAVADCTREETLDELIDEWLPKYRSLAVDNAPVVLAVNKVDLDDQEIPIGETPEKVLPYFDSIFYTSAKTGDNVEEMFRELGFSTKYRRPSLPRDQKDIVEMDRDIDEPRELISALLTYASGLGDISYADKQRIFKESGIDKFSLEDEISEKQALSFADGLIEFYEEKEDSGSASAVERLVEKYEE